VRVPAGADTIYVGRRNGVGPDGTVVGPGAFEQTRRARENVRNCLEAAGATHIDVVKWTILVGDGTAVEDGLAAFNEVWPEGAAPPAMSLRVDIPIDVT
jgi:enamine deaminase RidA (YjgF/YER057c/UK114 family)